MGEAKHVRAKNKTPVNRDPSLLAWHYTTGQKFKQISNSGLLIPSTIGVVPPELPVLWFSMHQRFEPTAVKTVVRDAERMALTLEEAYESGGGLCRFGISPFLLLAGEALRSKANISPFIWMALEQAGDVQGGKAADWLGTTDPLDIEPMAIDVMDDNMHWVRVRQGHPEAPYSAE